MSPRGPRQLSVGDEVARGIGDGGDLAGGSVGHGGGLPGVGGVAAGAALADRAGVVVVVDLGDGAEGRGDARGLAGGVEGDGGGVVAGIGLGGAVAVGVVAVARRQGQAVGVDGDLGQRGGIRVVGEAADAPGWVDGFGELAAEGVGKAGDGASAGALGERDGAVFDAAGRYSVSGLLFTLGSMRCFGSFAIPACAGLFRKMAIRWRVPISLRPLFLSAAIAGCDRGRRRVVDTAAPNNVEVPSRRLVSVSDNKLQYVIKLRFN